MSASAPRPFRVEVPQEKLDAVRAAVARGVATPAPDDDADWRYGMDVKWLAGFLRYWADEHDWRAQEERLNRWPQFKAEVDGLDIHFYHIKGSGPRPRPLVLTHGWPGSVCEFLHLFEPLCFPDDPADAFDLVIPSLPGVGFSGVPPRPMGPREVSGLWHRLMTEVLGYERYAAQGGDWGSSVTTWLGNDHPEAVAAIHLNLCVPPMYGQPANDAEAQWRATYQAVQMRESAYFFEHVTKTQTIAAVLDSSPVAAAAWILEKFHGWADTGGDIESRFSKDELIANLMFYLAEDKAGTSVWMYRGAAQERASGRFEGLNVTVPTAYAVFPKEFLPTPPRDLVERYYKLERWTEMAAGGHFAALEEPAAFTEDVRAFFRDRL